MSSRVACCVAVIAILAGTWAGHAQDVPGPDKLPQPPEGPSMPAADKGPPDKGHPDVPDPTAPGAAWQQIFAQKNSKGGAAAKLPSISLRGRVLSRDKPPMALIEVDGKIFSVGKDSLLTSANMLMKVVELNATEVRIQISPLNEIIILR